MADTVLETGNRADKISWLCVLKEKQMTVHLDFRFVVVWLKKQL